MPRNPQIVALYPPSQAKLTPYHFSQSWPTAQTRQLGHPIPLCFKSYGRLVPYHFSTARTFHFRPLAVGPWPELAIWPGPTSLGGGVLKSRHTRWHNKPKYLKITTLCEHTHNLPLDERQRFSVSPPCFLPNRNGGLLLWPPDPGSVILHPQNYGTIFCFFFPCCF